LSEYGYLTSIELGLCHSKIP